MSSVIKPTIGRVVLFVPKENKNAFGFSLNAGKPHNAHVAYVHSDTCVNLTVSDANGNTFGVTSVTLRQPGEPEPGGDYCEWMPYQIQAAQAHANK